MALQDTDDITVKGNQGYNFGNSPEALGNQSARKAVENTRESNYYKSTFIDSHH